MVNESIKLAEHEIRTNFPELLISSIESLGEGFRNQAVLVNDDWVFRFPKNQQAAEDLAKEIRLLPQLADKVKLDIPQFRMIGTQQNGRPFVGYRKLKGEIIGEDGLSHLNGDTLNQVAFQLADFLDALHRFPAEKAVQAGVPVRDLKNEFDALYREVKIHAFQLFDHPVREYISQRFESYLGQAEHFSYTPAFIHGDLSPDHFLLDPEKRELTGIIDFGDAVLSDPDYDYVYLLEDGGLSFTKQVMCYRGISNPDAKLKKIAWFVTFDQLHDLLEGIHSGDDARIAEGLELVEADMRLNRANGTV